MKKKENIIKISVIGGSQVDSEIYNLAYEVGKEIARNGAVLICGGLSGVMEASCKGAKEPNTMVQNKVKSLLLLSAITPSNTGVNTLNNIFTFFYQSNPITFVPLVCPPLFTPALHFTFAPPPFKAALPLSAVEA